MIVFQEIVSIMQIVIWSRNFSCHGPFIFIVNGYKHFVKLKSTSCPALLVVNGQKSSFKALLNGHFSPILLDGKRRETIVQKNRDKSRNILF